MRELYLIPMDGRQYGIWKDDILSVKDVQTLHRLPLSPACIAGMSIIDGRTVTLADLPVCIGHAPAAEGGKNRILILPGSEKVTGFVVSGELNTLAVPPEAVFPLPAYLATPVIDACAVHNNVPVPIINISTVRTRVLQTDQVPPMADCNVVGAHPQELVGAAPIRFFVVGDEPYAASAAGMEQNAIAPGVFSGLALLPQYVKGITFSHGQVLPLVDLCQRIKRQKAPARALMLIDRLGEAAFGLLVDEDRGTAAAGGVTIKLLPPIARAPWLGSAVLRDGEIIPLVDLAAMLSRDAAGSNDKPLQERYKPDSPFYAQFHQQDVQVVEFSLLGVRHALPRSEVEDIIGFKPYRVIPEAPQIMIGAAVHGDELLPVLDLAMVFGRRSLVTPEWRMIVVKNGDFRALVVCEAVFGERSLAQNIQRAVPILLPHRVVYGCYPETDAVRLILNVEAMAVHFEKSLVKELLPALSQEMREAPAELVASLLGEEEGETGQTEETAAPAASLSEQSLPAAVSAAEAFSPAESLPAESTGTDTPLTMEDAVHPEEPSESMPAPAEQKQEDVNASASINVGEPAKTASLYEQVPAKEQERLAGEEQAAEPLTSLPEEPASTASVEPSKEQSAVEGRTPERSETLQQEALPETVPVQEDHAAEALTAGPGIEEEPLDKDRALPEAAEHEESVIADITQQIVQQKPEVEVVEKIPAHEKETVALPAEEIPVKSFDQREVEVRAGEPVPTIIVESVRATGTLTHEEKYRLSDESGQRVSQPSSPAWLRKVAYGAVALVIILILYFTGTSRKPDIERPAKVEIPGKTDAEKPGRVETPAKTNIEKQTKVEAPGKPDIEKPGVQTRDRKAPIEAQTKAAHMPEKPHEPLVLEVPAGRQVEGDLYIVVKGDTLWDISERFTGDPFNYPRIAGENRIADPDLIFPGQKIRLTRKPQVSR